MNNLTNTQLKEINTLYEMISLGWHHTDHPMYHMFMQHHNELPDYAG